MYPLCPVKWGKRIPGIKKNINAAINCEDLIVLTPVIDNRVHLT